MGGPRITSIHDTPMIVQDDPVAIADARMVALADEVCGEVHRLRECPPWESIRAEVERLRAERDAAVEQAECDRLMLVEVLRIATGDEEAERHGPTGQSPADRIREYVGSLRAERDAACADLDALRAAAREHLNADDACEASVGSHTAWNLASGRRLTARLALRRLLDERADHLPDGLLTALRDPNTSLPGEEAAARVVRDWVLAQDPPPSETVSANGPPADYRVAARVPAPGGEWQLRETQERDALRTDLLAARAAWAALRDAAREVLAAEDQRLTCASASAAGAARAQQFTALVDLRRLVDGQGASAEAELTAARVPAPGVERDALAKAEAEIDRLQRLVADEKNVREALAEHAGDLRAAARKVLDADSECAATVDVYEDSAGVEEDGPVEHAQDRRIAAFAALRRLLAGGSP